VKQRIFFGGRFLNMSADTVQGFLAARTMKWKALSLYLAIPAILIGLFLLLSALTSVDPGRIAKNYLVRPKQYLVRYLAYRTAPPLTPQELNLTAAITPTSVVWEMLEQVDRDRALNDLRQLTGEEPICVSTGCYTITDRLTGTEGLDWAMDYLYENLVTLGYSVEFRYWSRSGYADQNLIARKMGVLTPTEEIYLVAHVDGVRKSEERYPAADDNASGVVSGLEMARIFSNHFFGRTVVLFFSTGEEQGALWVKDYLDNLSPYELGAIKYVVNYDTIGYDANGDGVMELAHEDHPPSLALAQVISETIDAYQLDLDQRIIAGCP
jgi:hypothetical protein